MKFRIAMLLLALAAILVAAGCNDSNYSADAADADTSAVETVAASNDTEIATPDGSAVEGKEGECSSCSGCSGDKDGVATTDASMEGKTCADGSSCAGKEGVETTSASADGKTCADGSSCEGKTCDSKGVETTSASNDAKSCEGCEGDSACEDKDGVETTKASNTSKEACAEGCECEGCAKAA